MTIEIYLEDLSTAWAANGDHGGWISEDVTEKGKPFPNILGKVKDFSVRTKFLLVTKVFCEKRRVFPPLNRQEVSCLQQWIISA